MFSEAADILLLDNPARRNLHEETAARLRGELDEGQRRKFDEMHDSGEIERERRERGEDCLMVWVITE